jgi:hypothetical protein
MIVQHVKEALALLKLRRTKSAVTLAMPSSAVLKGRTAA